MSDNANKLEAFMREWFAEHEWADDGDMKFYNCIYISYKANVISRDEYLHLHDLIFELYREQFEREG